VTTGQQTTGISDSVYDLTSVFYHAAQGGQVYDKYIEDAEKEGDHELVDFFREARDQDAERAQKAKSLLGRR
jgi:rubrerythrin